MISSVNFGLDQTIQTVRKPDASHPPAGVTGASAATAPQTSQAVTTVNGLEETRNDPDRLPRREDAERQAAEEQRTRIEVSVDRDSGKRVFKRVVAANGHVVWQDPEEKVLDRAREQKKTVGVITDKTV